MIDVYCEICSRYEDGGVVRVRPVASVEPEELSVPIRGSMFYPHIQGRGLPDPFPDVDWRHMACPMCGYRPWGDGGKRVLTIAGYYYIGVDPVPREPEAVPAPEHLENIPSDDDLADEWCRRMDEMFVRETRVEAPPDPFECKECGRIFRTKHALRVHFAKMHKDD